MKTKFEVIFLEQAIEFLEKLDDKSRKKIYYNIDKSKLINDPKLFKKLKNEIWEFRTKYNGIQYRLLAFWDKTEKTETLVISTHGIIKKVSKVPKSEIEKAERIRKEYFNS
jgi:phage-related protein